LVDVGLHEIVAPQGIYVLSTVEVVVDDSDERIRGFYSMYESITLTVHFTWYLITVVHSFWNLRSLSSLYSATRKTLANMTKYSDTIADVDTHLFSVNNLI
jgi:hypothetical protein